MLDGDGRERGIHDERPGDLTVRGQAPEDWPVPLARVEHSGGGRASQDDTTASASAMASGCSSTRTFVEILRNALQVSHANRTSSGPASVVSSQARAPSWSRNLGL